MEWVLFSRACLFLGVALLGSATFTQVRIAEAKVFYAKQEALATVFPDADEVETKSFFLTKEQTDHIQNLAKAPVDANVIAFYIGRKGETVLGYAFIETHIVRTLPETFLIVVSPSGTIQRVLTLAFYEPLEYLPTDRWIAQFDTKPLSPTLQLQSDIHGITGSTLTARAVTRGVRKVLALFEVLIRDSPHSPQDNAPNTPVDDKENR